MVTKKTEVFNPFSFLEEEGLLEEAAPVQESEPDPAVEVAAEEPIDPEESESVSESVPGVRVSDGQSTLFDKAQTVVWKTVPGELCLNNPSSRANSWSLTLGHVPQSVTFVTAHEIPVGTPVAPDTASCKTVCWMRIPNPTQMIAMQAGATPETSRKIKSDRWAVFEANHAGITPATGISEADLGVWRQSTRAASWQYNAMSVSDMLMHHVRGLLFDRERTRTHNRFECIWEGITPVRVNIFQTESDRVILSLVTGIKLEDLSYGTQVKIVVSNHYDGGGPLRTDYGLETTAVGKMGEKKTLSDYFSVDRHRSLIHRAERDFDFSIDPVSIQAELDKRRGRLMAFQLGDGNLSMLAGALRAEKPREYFKGLLEAIQGQDKNLFNILVLLSAVQDKFPKQVFFYDLLPAVQRLQEAAEF